MPDKCPSQKKHTKCPERYTEWHTWAEKKIKTHTQHKCTDCNLLVIWVNK